LPLCFITLANSVESRSISPAALAAPSLEDFEAASMT
jgi:hypothetical protein